LLAEVCYQKADQAEALGQKPLRRLWHAEARRFEDAARGCKI
jgi:hypothetical protein